MSITLIISGIIFFFAAILISRRDDEIQSLRKERDFYKDSLKRCLLREKMKGYIDPDSISLEDMFPRGENQ